ncbi:hypothetical protein Ddye_022738 [Dipteronia dyeriana]|uniref:HAT C-terminal dimerisation domain-containing protein n=1 Tax=Dipteronia dyeriana TaxID=168575 RepID=A0AAD9TSK3_9ROSI|nr:hypothetical protein Ddye_022738 [Dipteronia dyeriana]
MRVLGLTCSSSACGPNWSTFNQVHTKRRNRPTTTKLNNLVYIMYNKKLKLIYLRNRSSKKDKDLLITKNISSDDEWIANPNDEESTKVGDKELNLDVDEMANEIRGNLQLIDEGEDDFGDEDNEIGFDYGDRDGLNNYEYDHLPNDPNHISLDENND